MGKTQTIRERFGLNFRQEAFVLAMSASAEEGDQTRIYWSVYGKGKPLPRMNSQAYHNAASVASRLSKNAKVKAALDYLSKKAESKATLTRTRKREILAAIAEGSDPTEPNAGEKIRAVEADNRMTGDKAPGGVEAKVTGLSVAFP